MLLFFCFVSQAQVQTVKNQIYNFQFAEAEESIKKLPESAEKLYFTSLKYTVKSIISDDYTKYSKEEAYLDKIISSMESFQQEKDLNVLLAEVFFHKALLETHFNGLTASAANNFLKSYNLVKKHKEMQPNSVLHYKLDGIYNIFLSQVPENYQWVFKLFGVEGNLNIGFELLKDNSENIFSEERLLFYDMLSYQFLNKKNDLSSTSTKPKNEIELFVKAHLFIKEKKLSEAKRLIEFSEFNGKVNYYTFLLGEIALKQGQYSKSTIFLLDFLSNSKGNTFNSASKQYLYYCYFLKEENEKASKYIKELTNAKIFVYSKDVNAYFFAKNFKSSPNKQLLKAQLHYDGGNYTKALEELNLIDLATLSSTQKAEANYRKARVYQELNNYEKAVFHYEKAIETPSEDVFFKAKSHLELGKLQYSKKYLKAARFNFNESIKCKNHRYENEIEMEAKQLLISINESN